ncbi:MAG: hypothetical protein ACI8PZ_003048 [Myxococcota bacterium]
MALLLLASFALAGTFAYEGLSGDVEVWAPRDAARVPHGLLVVLHADDATPTHATRRARLRRVARRRDLILVAPTSPGPADSGCWWSPHKQRRAAYLAALLEDLVFAPYGAVRTRVYLAGKSGGAFWAAGVPFYGELGFSGGVVGVCGGDVPRLDSDTDWCAFTETEDDPPITNPAPTPGWTAYFAHTAGDPWADATAAAVELYRASGVPTLHVVTGPGGHCALDAVSWMVRGVDALSAASSGARERR